METVACSDATPQPGAAQGVMHGCCLRVLSVCAANSAERTAANVPVSQLGAQYVKDTRELTDAIETYITIVSGITLSCLGVSRMAGVQLAKFTGCWLRLDVSAAHARPSSAPPSLVTFVCRSCVPQSSGRGGRCCCHIHQLTAVPNCVGHPASHVPPVDGIQRSLAPLFTLLP